MNETGGEWVTCYSIKIQFITSDPVYDLEPLHPFGPLLRPLLYYR